MEVVSEWNMLELPMIGVAFFLRSGKLRRATLFCAALCEELADLDQMPIQCNKKKAKNCKILVWVQQEAIRYYKML